MSSTVGVLYTPALIRERAKFFFATQMLGSEIITTIRLNLGTPIATTLGAWKTHERKLNEYETY